MKRDHNHKSRVIDELACPLVPISMHCSRSKADAGGDKRTENTILGIVNRTQSNEGCICTFISERASTHPMSYSTTTLHPRGIREKKCSISATLYFCCSPGVSMFAKNRGMSWRQMSAMMPVSSKLSIAAFCFLLSAASYEVSHWSTASSGTATLYCRGGCLRAALTRLPASLTCNLGRK